MLSTNIQPAQTVIPISDLKVNPSAAINKLGAGPVLLAVRSHVEAVMVSVKEWNELIDDYRRLQRWIEGTKAKEAGVVDITDELMNMQDV